MELTDIFPLEEWKKFADSIYENFGLNGAIYKPDNFRLTKSDKWSNKICPLIQNSENVIICSSSQKRISKLVINKLDSVIDECDAGFIKFVVPIYVKKDLVGMAGGCGCLMKDSEIDIFFISKILELEEKDAEQLISHVPQISKEELEKAIKFVKEKIDDILKQRGLA
ncbi:MAG TPA: PocR ligand-binding domain-containing protein [Syntrophorhabdaceae bacterium]|nr:PocR ligand-binding domain-containing protein [Syntrophorhabdaceae bacterium]